MAKYHHILQTIKVPDGLFQEYLSVVAQNRYCYIYDDGSGWRTMFRWIDKEKTKKRFFPASELEIAKHISHEYPDAIGFRAAKETMYFDIDMDGNPDKYAMYQRMHEICHFLQHNDVGVFEVIVLERKDSGNLSIVGRCDEINTYEMARCMKTILSYALEDPSEVGKPGFVEIYPRRDRARRLPFAGDHQIISSDSFTNRYPSAIYESVSKSDSIQRFLSLPPINLKAFASSLEELWGNHEKKKAPMYTQPITQHYGAEGVALYCAQSHRASESIHSASAFTLRCNWLWEKGLSDHGTRHDAETDLILFFWMLGYSSEECYALIEGWYKSGKTNGYSKEWEANPEKVLRNLRSHVRSYYRWLKENGLESHGETAKVSPVCSIPLGLEDAVNTSARLSLKDVYVIHEIALRDLRCGEWLFDLMLYAKQRKVFLSRLFLSKETLRREFKNGEEKWTIYLQQCIDANLLERVGNHCNFNTRFGTFRRPRVFKVSYDFEEKALLPTGVDYRKALTEIYSAKQIRKMFPKTTAWRLNKLRNE